MTQHTTALQAPRLNKLQRMGMPPSTYLTISEPSMVNQFRQQKVNCTEDTEDTKETDEIEDIKVIKEHQETKESEELHEIDELSPDLWGETDRAITQCPVGNDKGVNHPLFELARRVRGIEEEMGKSFSVELTLEILSKWQIANADNLDVDHDYAVEFLAKLSLVRAPFGKQLAAALKSAKKSQPPPKKTQRLSAEVQLLASLCRELQRLAGNEPFYLDCRSCAKLLNKSHGTIATWLKALAYIGVILLEEKGRVGRASRYRYIAH